MWLELIARCFHKSAKKSTLCLVAVYWHVILVDICCPSHLRTVCFTNFNISTLLCCWSADTQISLESPRSFYEKQSCHHLISSCWLLFILELREIILLLLNVLGGVQCLTLYVVIHLMYYQISTCCTVVFGSLSHQMICSRFISLEIITGKNLSKKMSKFVVAGHIATEMTDDLSP